MNKRVNLHVESLSGSQLLKLQEQELSKEDTAIDWAFVDACSDEVIRRSGKTMDWAPSIDEAYRELMQALGREPAQGGEPERPVLPQRIAAPAAHSDRPHPHEPHGVRQALFSAKYILVAVFLFCLLIVGAYADINGRIVKNTNYIAFDITQEDMQASPQLTDNLQTDSPVYKKLETLGVQQALLPSSEKIADALDMPPENVQWLERQGPVLLWEGSRHYIRYTIVSAANMVTFKIHYRRSAAFTAENGIQYQMFSTPQYLQILFCANDLLYVIYTDLDWDTARDIALSIH